MVRRELFKKYFKKGVSDLVVILALVAVAIPIMMTVQHWLSAQAGRVSSYVAIPSLYATVLSKSKSDTSQTIVVKLENKGSETYVLSMTKASVVLINGSVINGQIQLLAGSSTLTPGSSTIVVIKVDTVVDASSIVLELINPASNTKESLSVSLT